VQWCLFWATAAAFGAAFYYATIARQQKDIMDRQWRTLDAQWQTLRHQWATMSKTLGEVQKQTPMFDKAANAAQKQSEVSDRATAAAERALHITESPDIQILGLECSTLPHVLSPETAVRFVYKSWERARYGGI
jgi:hypothetical protein